MTLKNVHIHVDWNSSPLYDEDDKGLNVYDSDVEYNLGWNVPSFAPSGHYDIHVTGTGDAASLTDAKVMCIYAQMDLWASEFTLMLYKWFIILVLKFKVS